MEFCVLWCFITKVVTQIIGGSKVKSKISVFKPTSNLTCKWTALCERDLFFVCMGVAFVCVLSINSFFR